MKLLICSDLHGSKNAAILIKSLMNKIDPDKLLLLGDFLYNGPRNPVPNDYNPKDVYEILNEFSSKIIACKGNCDSDVDLMVLNFKIPRFNGFKYNNKSFYLTHGDIKDYCLNNDVLKDEFLLMGHTHIPLVIKAKSGGIILNPGSMTFPKGSIDKSFMVLENSLLQLYEFDYDKNNIAIYKNIYDFNLDNFKSKTFKKEEETL